MHSLRQDDVQAVCAGTPSQQLNTDCRQKSCGCGSWCCEKPTREPASLFDGPSSQPTHTKDHSHRSPCSHAHFGLVTGPCVSSPQRLDCLHRLANAGQVHIRIAGDSFSLDTVVVVVCLSTCVSRPVRVHIGHHCNGSTQLSGSKENSTKQIGKTIL